MIPVELTPDNWVDYRFESALDAYSSAVNTLMASLLAQQVQTLDKKVTPEYIEWLENRAFNELKRANRQLERSHAPAKTEAEFIADALVLATANQST